MASSNRPTLIVITQVYPPDPAAVGQYIHDVAVEMTRRGYRTIVYTSNRGYEVPSKRFPRREQIDGVEIRRLPLSGFGKSSIPIRVLGGLSFTLQAACRCLFASRMKLMLVSTSPPMCGLAAVLVGLVRGVHVTYWAMDLNPDQMVAMGKVSPRSLFVRSFDWLNRRILSRARVVVALDRFMAERVNRKRDVSDKVLVLPPWPHEDHIEPVAHDENPFRKEHSLAGKTVIMYSGNLSPASPVTTIIEAARRVEDLTDLVFLFVGGGLAKKEIDSLIARENPPNIRSLPYQPIDQLRYSLSAADVHLVSMGNEIVGICHPCKIYGALAASRPVLALGPKPSHITDIVDGQNVGWTVGHGDVDGAERIIREIYAMAPTERMAMGDCARQIVDRQFAMKTLRSRFCDAVEHGVDVPRAGT
jgi:colanic acid biosynthesis glycosyl transferase WcaI